MFYVSFYRYENLNKQPFYQKSTEEEEMHTKTEMFDVYFANKPETYLND